MTRRRALTTLIRNGTVVTSEKTFPADILIDGERIREVAANIPIDTRTA
jgi:dihydroorotase-like cyclic amidohydrolase